MYQQTWLNTANRQSIIGPQSYMPSTVKERRQTIRLKRWMNRVRRRTYSTEEKLVGMNVTKCETKRRGPRLV